MIALPLMLVPEWRVDAPAPAGDWLSGTGAALALDTLLEGLEDGRYCGVPVVGNAPRALIEVLRRRSWPADARAFAGAMPHFPEEFGLVEVRNSLARLGFPTRAVEYFGRDLPCLPQGAFVLHRGAMRFAGAFPDGRPGLVDPETGRMYRVGLRRRYECYVIGEPEGEHSNREPVLRRFRTRFRKELGLVLMVTTLSSALVVVASMSVAFIFDTVLPTKALDTLLALLVGIAALIAVDLRLRKIKARLIGHVAGRIEFILSAELYEKLIGFSLDLTTGSPISEQVSRVKQFETMRDFFCGPVVTVFAELPFVTILALILLVLDLPTGLTVLAAVSLYGIIGAFALSRVRSATAVSAQRSAEYSRRLAETMSERDQIVHRGLGRTFVDRLQPSYERATEARLVLDQTFEGIKNLTGAMTPLVIGAAVCIGALQVIRGELTPGILIACTILTARLLAPIQQALLVGVRAPEILSVFAQLDRMMQIPSSNGRPTALVLGEERVREDRLPLVVGSAAVRYPGTAAPALKGVSLRIEQGSLVCLGGPSGSGKSTLLRAVMGAYSLQSGAIYVGSVNLDQLSAHHRTELIGYLGHYPFLIHGTVAQNLRLARPDATIEQLRAVSDELGLLESIEALSGGFEAKLDIAGLGRTTSAFRTKLAIAQLLLRDPAILMLDAPGAVLSPGDEARLMDAIDRRGGRTTCLLVTQRPSVLRRADLVVMMQAGQVRFAGRPEQVKFR